MPEKIHEANIRIPTVSYGYIELIGVKGTEDELLDLHDSIGKKVEKRLTDDPAF